MRSVYQDASFELSTTVFGQFLKFVIIFLGRLAQKVNQHGEKGRKKILKLFFKLGGNKEQDLGGKSHVITFGVFPFKNGTLWRTGTRGKLGVHNIFVNPDLR